MFRPFSEWLDVKKPYIVYVNKIEKQEPLFSSKNVVSKEEGKGL